MAFADLPIRRKLTVIIMLTASVMVVLAAAAFVAYDYATFRQKMVADLAVLAEMVEANASTALLFNDKDTAQKLLVALKAQPRIVSARLWAADGTPFAEYVRAGDTVAPSPRPDGTETRFEPGRLRAWRKLAISGRDVGTVEVTSDLQEIGARMRSSAAIVGVLLPVLLGLAFVLSARLQKIVSGPILQLVGVTRVVTTEKDYAVRARKESGDELGLLVDAVNEMLGEIQARHADLMVAKDQAEDANRAKSTFLANMSHELRTPLNAIIGYSEMLQEELIDAGHADMVTDLKKIHAAGRHLLALINDILDLSKIEAGKMDLVLEPFEVATVVNEVATTIKPLVDKNKNTIDVKLGPRVGIMHADVTRLLTENRDKLDSLTEALLEAETLDEVDAYRAAGVERDARRDREAPGAVAATQ